MNEYGDFMDKAARIAGTRGELLVVRGCCIRFAPGKVHSGGWFEGDGGPYVHANSAHIALGVRSVRVQEDGDLEITTDGMTPVVTCSMSGDETLSVRGILGGASVGAVTVVRFYKVGSGRLYLNRQDDWDAIAGTFNNLWCSWLSIEQRGADPA